MLVTIHKNGTLSALQMLEYSLNFEYAYTWKIFFYIISINVIWI